MGKSGGEIAEVEGGHIVRGSGGKDRHSKVCTAKGPRDRRVRLAAHTAIQFYDVQDRLGYDRPSKAVDWLIHKAKSAIAQLPPWHPTDVALWTTQPHEEDRRQFVGSTFVPPSSFFPGSAEASFASSDLMPTNAQDLRLSLHSFQDPILHHQTNLDAWNGAGDGYLFNHFISHRGTLQSSNTHPLQAWMDPNHPIHPFPFHNHEDHAAGYSHKPSSASSD